MKIPLTYGFLSGLGGAVVTLLLYFAGMHESVEKLPTAQWVGGILGIAILITALALGMRDKRAKAPADADWGYGSAFGTGVLVALFASIFSSVFYFIYASYINPGFVDVIFQAQQAGMEAKGLTEAQISNAEPMMRKMMSPGVSAVLQLVFGFVVSVVISAIVAAFFRSRPHAGDSEAPPALS